MKRWKDRLVRIGKGVTACVAAGALISASGSRSQSGSGPNRSPFTMQYIQTVTNVTRGTSFALDMFWAVRSDGARAFGLAGISPRRRTVVDPVQKIYAHLSDAYRLKSTYDYRNYPVTPRRIPYGAKCYPPGNEFLYVGDDVILGYRAHHYIMKPFPGSSENQESHYWLAPDLGCYKIQHVMYVRDENGAITNVFEEKPAKITKDEPDPALFAVPADYREVRPSEFERALLYGMIQQREGYEGVGRHIIPESTLKGWAIADEKYDNIQKGKIK